MKRFLLILLSFGLLLSNLSYTVAGYGDTAYASESKEKKESEEEKSLWPKGPSVDAKAAVLMDCSTGLVLYEKNALKKEYPASITKIMTTLLALENCDLDEVVTFSHNAVFNLESGSTHIGIDEGEQLTVEQCLYAIMLASANEVSNGIAEHISGSITDFATLMNQRAKELGCQNTHFANANGLHDDNHYTCAYDMALIGREALKNSIFQRITATKSYSIPPTNKHDIANAFTNHHKMLVDSTFQYEYCIGGKTGYTTKAGNTLVTFAKKGEVTLICVVMRANGPTSEKNEYTDTTSLFEWGFENFTQYSISQTSLDSSGEDTGLFTKYTPFFDTSTSPLRLGDAATILLPKTASLEDATKEITYLEDVTLTKGDNVIGTITYTYGGKTVGSTNIIFTKEESYALTTADEPQEIESDSIRSGKKWNLKPLIIAIIFLIIGIFIYLYWRIRHGGKKGTLRFR
jgi:D-alanyl-D-alanine carboxypeptidase